MSDSHAHAHSDGHVHHSHVKLYVTIYLALLVLVLATVGAAYVKLGVLSFPVCMGIATLKTVLIVAFFMHVKDETPLIQVFSIIGALWLAIFFTFLLGDYLTRRPNGVIPNNAQLRLMDAAAHGSAVAPTETVPDHAPGEAPAH